MLFVTGDETGLIKLVDAKKKLVAVKCGLQSRKNGIIASVIIPQKHLTIATYTTSGTVEIWDVLTAARIHVVEDAGESGLSLHVWGDKFVTATKDGDVRIFNISAKSAESGEKFNVGGSLGAAVLHEKAGYLAVGGMEKDLQLWDLTTQKRIFQARNAANDYLDRRMAVWITGIVFISEESANKCGELAEEEEKTAAKAAAELAKELHSKPKKSSRSEGGETPVVGKAAMEACLLSASHAKQMGENCCFATITAHKQVRIYNPTVSPRPIRSVDYGDMPLACVATSSDGEVLYVSDVVGTLRQLNLSDGTLRQTGGFRHTAGCINQLAVHPTKPYIAAVGLDRHLYVWHTLTRERVRRVYLKQRVMTGLWVPGDHKHTKDDDSDDDDDDDDDADELEAEDMFPLRELKITGMANVKLAQIIGAGVKTAADLDAAGSGSGDSADEAGEGDETDGLSEDDNAVWKELDRRRKATEKPESDEEEEDFSDEEDEDDEDDDDDDSVLDFDEEDDDDDEIDDDDDDDEEEEEAPSAKRARKTPGEHNRLKYTAKDFVDSSTAARKLKKQVYSQRRVEDRESRKPATKKPTRGKARR